MNSAFAADTAAIFAGPLATPAVWRPAAAPEFAVRVIAAVGDAIVDFDRARLATGTGVFLVPVASVSAPQSGDRLIIDGMEFVVQGSPRRDPRRLWWRIEARPVT